MEQSDQSHGWFERIDQKVYHSIWNDVEGRFRVPVRMILAAAPLTLLLIISFLIKGAITDALPIQALLDDTAGRILSSTGSQVYAALTIVVALALSSWAVDLRQFSVPSWRQMSRWGSDLGFGLVLGLFLQIGILGVGLATGSITVTATFTGIAGQMPIFWGLNLVVFYCCTGLFEEALFRWYLMRNIAEGILWFDDLDQRFAVWGAIGLSAIAFSLWHTGSPVQFLLLAGCFGLFFGFAYSITGSIALPVGVHAAWNLGETGLFASQALPTDTMVETAIGNPIPIFGSVTLMDILPFLAVLLATVSVMGWVHLQEKDKTLHGELAIPSLHDRFDHRLLIANMYPERFEKSE